MADEQLNRFSRLLASERVFGAESEEDSFYDTNTSFDNEGQLPLPLLDGPTSALYTRNDPEVEFENVQTLSRRRLPPVPTPRGRPTPMPRSMRSSNSDTVSDSLARTSLPVPANRGAVNSSAEAVIDNAYRRYVTSGSLPLRRDFEHPVVETAKPVAKARFRTGVDLVEQRPLHSTGYHESETFRLLNSKPRFQFGSEVPLQSTLDEQSFIPAPETRKRVTETTEGLLKSLVDQFTSVVQGKQNETSGTSNVKVDLRAPRFDGNSDVHMFITQFEQVSKLGGWSDQIALVQLRNCLEKGAKDCGRASTLQGVYSRLLAMFGMTPSMAREKLHNLRREPGESYLQLGNRVERLSRLAYGGLGDEAESSLALEHFDRALDDPSLRQHLLVVNARGLDEAVRAAEQYALVGPQASRTARGRDPARVNQVDSAPLEGNTEHALVKRMEDLFGKLAGKLDDQAARLSALEKAQSKNSSKSAGEKSSETGQQTKKRGCFKCGDLSHFKRDCPLLANADQKKSEN